MNHFVEIRSYNLKPGTWDEFRRFYVEETFPIFKRVVCKLLKIC